MYLHPSFCITTICIKCQMYLKNCIFMYFYFYLLYVLFWLHGLTLICPHIFHMTHIYICLPSFVFLLLSCFCVCVSCCVHAWLYACLHLCVTCMHICGHGTPEDEGRPRRRRTPRFLLKPWTWSRQATDSRLGLQVNKAKLIGNKLH